MVGLGLIELVIVAGMLLVLIGVPIVLLFVLLRKSRDAAQYVCPACQGKFAGAAKFCPHCGQQLG